MYRVQAWNSLSRPVDVPSAPMDLRSALELVVEYRDRGFRRITLFNVETGERFTDLEHFMRGKPED